MRNENLSDSRGNALGIRIFLLLLRIMGVNRTCELVWVVTFFYVCFDRKARLAARPYLRHRFPGAGAVRLFFHTWALFTSQGQAIVERAAMTRNIQKIGRNSCFPVIFLNLLITCHLLRLPSSPSPETDSL